jgi:hypothetical protein
MCLAASRLHPDRQIGAAACSSVRGMARTARTAATHGTACPWGCSSSCPRERRLPRPCRAGPWGTSRSWQTYQALESSPERARAALALIGRAVPHRADRRGCARARACGEQGPRLAACRRSLLRLVRRAGARRARRHFAGQGDRLAHNPRIALERFLDDGRLPLHKRCRRAGAAPAGRRQAQLALHGQRRRGRGQHHVRDAARQLPPPRCRARLPAPPLLRAARLAGGPRSRTRPSLLAQGASKTRLSSDSPPTPSGARCSSTDIAETSSTPPAGGRS